MRELSMVELEQVDGAGAPVVVAVVVVSVIAIGGLALLAYAVSEQCSGSLEISTEGVKVEVDCSGKG